MLQLFAEVKPEQLMATAVYGILGCLLFLCVYKGIETFSPFSVKKEIVEDQNTALGIIIGSVMIGLSIIIASAIR